MTDERRDLERVALLGGLPGELMVYQPMSVCDISLNGATIESAFPLQLDSLHDLRLTLGDHSVVLKARVVHSQITDIDPEAVVYRSGLQFVEPPERTIAAIARYIAQLKAARGGA